MPWFRRLSDVLGPTISLSPRAQAEISDGSRSSERPQQFGMLHNGCGLGFEIALLLPPLVWLRQMRRGNRQA
jgi:hypothetical protein